jgi:hydrogenase-4 component F
VRTLPVTGVLWVAGFLAIAGSPPFGPFLSELTILKGVIDADRPVVAVFYLAALAVVFVGMATIVLRMAYGPPPSSLIEEHVPPAARGEPLWSIAPAIVLVAAVLALGVYVPPRLAELLHQAAILSGGA